MNVAFSVPTIDDGFQAIDFSPLISMVE